MNKTLVVGLTGQTGSGKTTLCTYLSELGYPVINCDSIARRVVEPGTPCLSELVEVFGKEILTPGSGLDRRKLASIVFADKTKLEKLNRVINPYIFEKIKHTIEQYRKYGEKLVVLDAPTLFESGADQFCDVTISIIAPRDIRQRRIMQRDGLTVREAENRMNSQNDDYYYMRRSDHVITNVFTTEQLKRVAADLFEQILQNPVSEGAE